MPTDDACAASSPRPKGSLELPSKVAKSSCVGGSTKPPGILVKQESGLNHSPQVNHDPEVCSWQTVRPMRQVPLERDTNIDVNGCSGFATSTQKGLYMAMVISRSRGTYLIDLYQTHL